MLESKQVSDLMEGGAALHLGCQDPAAAIVKRQGDARGRDLEPNILAPGLADAVPGKPVDPLHDDVGIRRRCHAGEANWYALGRPVPETRPYRVNQVGLPSGNGA